MLFARWKTEFQYGGGSGLRLRGSDAIISWYALLPGHGRTPRPVQQKKNKAAGEKLGFKSQWKLYFR